MYTKTTKQKNNWFMAFALLTIIFTGSLKAQLTGTKNIPGDYATLALAITDLNAQGVGAGGVTLNLLSSNPETAPAGGYAITATGVLANPITIQGNSNVITANASLTAGALNDAIFKIIGGDYITISGFNMQENAANTATTAASNNMTEFGVAIFAASTTDGAQNNTIQNNTITLSNLSAGYQNAIGIFSSSASSSTNGTQAAASIAGTNSNNKFYSNIISGVASGIYFISPAQTATVFESGNDIGGTSLATGNTITYGISNTAGNLGFTSYSGATPAGIYFRNVVGNSARYNTINSVATLTLTSGGIFSATGTAPTGVTYTSNFSNNNITITNASTTAFTGIDFGSGLATGTAISNNNIITLTQNLSAAVSAAVTGIKSSYTFASNTSNSNTITINQSTSGTGTTSSALIGIDANGAATTINALSNIIIFDQTTSSSSAVTSPITGIRAATASTNVNIGSTGNGNTITIKEAITGSGSYGAGAIIYINAQAGHSNLNISSNNLNTTGSVLRTTSASFGINHNGTIVTSLNVTNNTINVDRSGAITGTGGFTGIHSFGSTNISSNYNVNSNNITLIGASGNTGALIGINNQDGPTAGATPVKTINNNTITISGAPTTAYGIYYDYGTFNIGAIGLPNTISISSSQISPTLYGISFVSTNSSISNLVSNNIVSISASSTGASSPVLSGIRIGGSTTTNLNNNTVSNISTGLGSGNATINGIEIISGGTNNVSKNKIFNISSDNSGVTTVISGLKISGGTTNTVYNNIIGDLRTPAVNATNPLIGLSIVGGTTNNVYYNTVNVNGTSSGTNFGSSAISANATPTTINLRNNIFVNNSTPNGTGISVAYRRASTVLTNYATTSNNNLFYAGTPSATNAIFTDGTNTYTTLAAYKTAMATRDQISVTENPTFLSTTGSSSNFLHINTATTTAIEGGAVNISSITDDFDGDIRQGNSGYVGTGTSPDIGADEFEGTSPTPIINNVSITPTGNQCTAASRNVTANVSPGGSALTSVTLYYSFNGVPQTPITMTGGNLATTSTWNATIPVGVPANATINWYVEVTDGTFTKISNGTSYSDEPSSFFTASATVTPTNVCAGKPVSLSFNLLGTNTSTYCTIAAATSTASYFNGFSTTGGIDNITNNTSGFSAGGYGNFTSLIASQKAGQNINFNTILAGTTVGVAIWVDWDQNGTFDAAERVFNTTGYVSTATGSFSVPATAKLGSTRMRIFMDYNNSNPAAPCGPFATGSRGEVEDYTFLVLPSASLTYSWTDGTTTFTSSTNPSTVIANASSTYTGTTLIGGCPLSSTVQVNTTPLPSAPIVSNSSQCGIGVSSASLVGGTSYNWYASPTSTTVLQSGTETNFTTSINSTTTWYATSVNGACESTPRVAITTTVSLPDAVVASTSAANLCVGGTSPATLTATQTGTTNAYTFSWDASPVSGSGMPSTVSGATASILPTIPGTYTYSVTASDGVCTTVSTVTVALNNLPSITASANPTMICSGDNVNLNAQSINAAASTATIGTGATTGTSYDGIFYHLFGGNKSQQIIRASELSAAGLVAGNLTALTINIPTAGATYSGLAVSIATTTNTDMSAGINNTAAFTTVYSNPAYTTVTGANTFNFSSGYNWNGTSNIIVQICWSNNNGGGTDNFASVITTAYVSTAYYRADSQTASAICGAATASGTLSKRALFVFNGQVGANVSASMNFNWNPGAITTNTAIVNPVNTGTAAATQIYTATVTNPVTNCSNTTTIGVLVNIIPVVPVATNSIQCGAGIPTAAVSGGTSYNWYASPTSTTVLQSGSASNFTSSINTTTTWYVSSSNGFCESPRVSLTQTVTPPPILSVTTPTNVVCVNSIETLSITSTLADYDNYTWTPNTNLYTDAAATIPYTGGSASTLYYFSSAISNNTYSINANSTSSGCVNSASVVINSSKPTIIASATPTLLCSGATVSLTANTNIISTGNVSIGTATTLTGATDELTAFCNRRISYRMQTVYTAAELSAAGLVAGNINSISYSVSTLGDAATNANFTVKCGTTTATAFTNFIATTGFSTVYAPAVYTHSVGLNTIIFNSPYAWDGVSNLVIEVSHDGADDINNARTYYTATAGNMIVYSYDGNTTGTASTNRLNIIFNGQRITTGAGSISWNWNPGSINTNTAVVTPINTGSTPITETYTVTALDPATTCTNSAVVTLSVVPVPTVAASVSSASICSGNSATLTATGATTYSWSNSVNTATQNVSPAVTSIYTVTGTTNGCSNTATVSLNVTASPTVIASTTSNSLCSGNSATLTASGATNYTWTSGGNTSTEVVSPSTTTTYTVTGESTGCTSASTVAINVTTTPTVAATASSATVCTGNSATLTASGATNYTWTSGGTTSTESVTPTALTVYTVTGETSGCSSTATVSVDVNSIIPTVTISASSASVCSGSSATLTAGGATNYTWTSGGTTSTEVVTPTTLTVYTVTGVTSGCSNTATISLAVNQSPTVTAVASQTLLCDDGSTGSSILTASSNGTTYLWSDGATTMTTVVTPTATTVYTITATGNGCSTDAYVTVTVSNCNGIKDLTANEISIFPNPTNGIVTISIPVALEGNVTVEVYDAIGKLTIKENITNNMSNVNLSKLEDGMYMFKIINNNKAIKIGKIVKQ